MSSSKTKNIYSWLVYHRKCEFIMTEIMKTEPVVYTKNFGNYDQSEDNFVASQELTVTITLQEYRNLIKASALSHNKYDKLQSEKWEIDRELEKVKNQLGEANSKLAQIQTTTNFYENKDDENV